MKTTLPTYQPAKPKHRLRWHQFSLRSLLIFVTLVAVACSWFAVKKEQAKKQRLAVEEIKKQGGSVMYGFCKRRSSQPCQLVLQPDGHWRKEQYPESYVRNWLGEWLGEDFTYCVVWADVNESQSIDALKDLDYCTDLTLDGIAIDSDVSESLVILTQLRTISLCNCRYDEETRGSLRKRMPKCEISIDSSSSYERSP
jgi:hypothetical protein